MFLLLNFSIAEHAERFNFKFYSSWWIICLDSKCIISIILTHHSCDWLSAQFARAVYMSIIYSLGAHNTMCTCTTATIQITLLYLCAQTPAVQCTITQHVWWPGKPDYYSLLSSCYYGAGVSSLVPKQFNRSVSRSFVSISLSLSCPLQLFFLWDRKAILLHFICFVTYILP